MTTKTPQEITRERAEVMLHFANGGEVEYCVIGDTDWYPIITTSWNWNDNDYRIAKPKPKKVKLLAYFDGACLAWYDEEYLAHQEFHKDCKRVPSEDKEIEVADD